MLWGKEVLDVNGGRAVVTLDTGPLIRKLSDLWGEPLEPYFKNHHPVI